MPKNEAEAQNDVLVRKQLFSESWQHLTELKKQNSGEIMWYGRNAYKMKHKLFSIGWGPKLNTIYMYMYNILEIKIRNFSIALKQCVFLGKDTFFRTSPKTWT